jgi:photosystem II stability/assembly factor-like uncharacterized protein
MSLPTLRHRQILAIALGLLVVGSLVADPGVGATPIPASRAESNLWPPLVERIESSTTVAEVDPRLYGIFRYRTIGPPGNRVISVVGEPGNPLVVYAGAASGGIWKTTDGGNTWAPIFDDQTAQSIGSLAIAPSDHNVVWAGTGESFVRSNFSIGDGIYKSTDAGRTWTNTGLGEVARIGRIVIHPTDPDVVYAAALGHIYGPQQERGVFRTTDGGATWERVLFVNEDTGASDLAMDPSNPRHLIAGMWTIDQKTWVRTSGGPEGGVYESSDGGETWEHLGPSRGLPQPPVGKVAVAFAPSDPNRIYALIETDMEKFDGILWRSDNGGGRWQQVSMDYNLYNRPHYYTRVAVSPTDADEVYFPAHGVRRSTDGGRTWYPVPGVGGDDHDMWIDPDNADRMLVGNDGGVRLSFNRGQTWARPELPIAQIYHVSVDDQIPYYVYGNRQDGPSRRGLSRGNPGWHSVGGGESGFTYADWQDNNIIWSGNYGGSLTVYSVETGHSRNVRIWPDNSMGWGPADLEYRWNWTTPIHISPHDSSTIYAGSQHVHRTTNGGQSWEVISPDLTTNDKSRQLDSGGLTIDNAGGVDAGATLFAIAESRAEQGVIWAGSNDGQVSVTRNGGRNWTNVSANIPGLSEWGTVSNIEPSRFAAGTAYISVDLHQMNNRDPYAYRTEDFGQTWTKITDGVPRSVFSYVHVIREDPFREGMLYLGTENSIYFSLDDGESWNPIQANMPHAPVHWLTIQERFSDLVVGTYGRGFWIMNDISPLRQLTDEVLASDVHLFDAVPTYRGAIGSANINYWLNDPPDGPVTITITDESGNGVTTLRGTRNQGINRVSWNLRHESKGPPVRLRTLPPDFPEDPSVWPQYMSFNADGWRSGGGPAPGPGVVPGSFTVTLKVGNDEQATELVVHKDPASEGTLADIRAQNELAFRLQDARVQVAIMANALEWVRKQIKDLGSLAAADSRDLAAVLASLDEVGGTATALESEFFNLKHTYFLRSPAMLMSKLGSVGSGSVDFPPTDQQVEVAAMLIGQAAERQAEFDALVNQELPRINQLLTANGLPIIVVPKEQR